MSKTLVRESEKPFMKVVCSTGAFSQGINWSNHKNILAHASQLQVAGFEALFYGRWYPHWELVAEDFCASGLTFAAIHAEKSIGEVFGSDDPGQREEGLRKLEQNCSFAQRIGARVAVLHLWGLPYSDTQFENNLQPLKRSLDIAERYGIELAIETIPCKAADPLSNVERAYTLDSRVRVALDTEFLGIHQQLDAVFAADWLWKEQLVRHVHIKDYDGNPFPAGKRRYLHPGEGHIDFERFVTDLHRVGFAGALSLEAPAIDKEGKVDLARIQASLQRIKGTVFSVLQ
jgi:sugar phosphate isomerase/epimerase